MDKNTLISIRKYRGRVRRDPHQKVHAPLAEAYRLIGLMEDAAKTCRNGLEIHTSYLLCREVLGRILFRAGHLEEARDQLEKVHRIVRDDSELHRVLAKLYLRLDEKDMARPLIESVLNKDPLDYEMRSLLSTLDGAEGSRSVQEDQGEKPKPKRSFVIDLESILAQDDDSDYSATSRAVATDSILDELDGIDDLIQAGAEDIFSTLSCGEPRRELAAKPRPLSKLRGGEDFLMDGRALMGAALAAQLHFEIALLEEAFHLTRGLLEEERDSDFLDLADRLQSVMRQKEVELDHMED